MKPYSLLLAYLLLSACATTGTSSAGAAAPLPGSIKPIDSLDEVEPLLATLPKGRTLVIFDIDDTLLTAKSPAFFGSDLWYNWQKAGAPGGAKIACMSDVLALNYQAAHQRSAEGALGPALLNRLTQDTLLLTSRSPNYREGTERELKEAEYPVLRNLPSRVENTLTGTAFRHPEPSKEGGDKLVTYANGILMTEGGNKGVMLLDLFKHLRNGRRYKNIVLIDDTGTKQTDMRDALAGHPYRFYGLHYLGVKDDRKKEWLNLTAPQLEEAQAFGQAFQPLLLKHYPELAKRCAFTR